MIYECKVYRPNGKLEKIHKAKFLKKRFWDKFIIDPWNHISSLKYHEGKEKNKINASRAQIRHPKPCKWCEKVFTPSHPKVKTCSKKCKTEYLNAYFKKRRVLIKKGLLIAKRRGPSRRKNVPRI